MSRLITSPYFFAFLAGAIAVFGFAPFGIFPLPILSLVVLFWLWSKAERRSQAAWLGFAFSMGLFCVGVSWIYVALHDYGYIHPLLAALATALFAAVNASIPALAGYGQSKVKSAATYGECCGHTSRVGARRMVARMVSHPGLPLALS
ncbi:MAG: hypothetical protein IPH85_14520 [Ignavibacteria bacterium]|nr:hypothetical protein [Ignavibacteria bacterium]